MEFSRTINAKPDRVWDMLWGKDTYKKWTSPFAEGSDAETDWKQGSKIIFHDGSGSGMVSRVEKSEPPRYLGITHLGFVKDGVEDYDSDEVKPWAGSYENYTLTENNGKTDLKVELGGAEIPQEHVEHFEKAWPKALDILQELAER